MLLLAVISASLAELWAALTAVFGCGCCHRGAYAQAEQTKKAILEIEPFVLSDDKIHAIHSNSFQE